MSSTDESKAYELNKRVGPDLLKRPGVAGVGVGQDDERGYYLAVHLVDENAKHGLPDEIDGMPVKFEITGEYRPQGLGGLRP